MKNEDKSKTTTYNQSDLTGVSPFSKIGPGRTADVVALVSKLKKKKVGAIRAEGSAASIC